MKSDVVQWRGADLAIRARWVPRCLWCTASIDVFLAGECVLRTGGQLKIVGSATNGFDYQGTRHEAKLSWGRYERGGFPIEVKIDGEHVASSHLVVENWWAAWIRNAVLLLVMLVMLLLLLLCGGLFQRLLADW